MWNWKSFFRSLSKTTPPLNTNSDTSEDEDAPPHNEKKRRLSANGDSEAPDCSLTPLLEDDVSMPSDMGGDLESEVGEDRSPIGTPKLSKKRKLDDTFSADYLDFIDEGLY